MTREIDKIPTPAHVREQKLIVLSASRNGTLGTYMALKELGFRPYHLMEAVIEGPMAFKLLTEATQADLLHQGKFFTRKDFDKIFADYDCLVEVPFLLMRSILKAYPDAKFLLVERNPEKWAHSYVTTVAKPALIFDQFPMSILKYFDNFAFYTHLLGVVMNAYFMNSLGDTPEGRQALIENYNDYIADVKRLVPPEQLKVCRLEDGFGWDELCPYLGVPIPDTPWPTKNTPEDFKKTVYPRIRWAIIKGVVGVTTITSATAVGIWYARPFVRQWILALLA